MPGKGYPITATSKRAKRANLMHGPSKTKSRRSLVQCAALGLVAKIMESAVVTNATCTVATADEPTNGVSYLVSQASKI